MSNILSLEDFADNHRVTIGSSIDDEFCTRASKMITRCGHTKDRMRAVNECASNIVARSEWKSIFEKEEQKKK